MSVQPTHEPRRWGLVAGAIAVLVALHALPRFVTPPTIVENRELARMPTWAEAQAERWGLPKKLDAYVQDQFPARAHLISGLNWLRMQIGDSGSSRVVVGRGTWLFYDDGSHLGTARAAIPLADAEVDRWVQTLQARTQAMRAADAAYVVVVPPVKERVYPEYAPRWMRDGGEGVDGERLQRAAAARGLSNVLYLLPAMRELRTRFEPVYSPYDIHWTGIGAYEGYVRLAQELARQGVEIETWPLSRYSRRNTGGNVPRDVALMLGVADFVEHDFPQFEYVPVESRLSVEYLTERHDWTGARVIDTGQEGKPVLVFTGDSFSNDLLPFLYPHFSRLVVAHNQDGYFRTDLIERYKPDAVVVEILESGVRHAMTPPLEPSSPATAVASQGAAETASPAAAAPAIQAGWTAVAPSRLQATAALGSATCNLEVAQRIRMGDADGIHVEGWMFDGAGRRAAASTTVLLSDAAGNAWAHAVANSVSRPDVASHFGVAAAASGGFRLEAKVPGGARAPYTVALLQSYGATELRCGPRPVP